jgi:hypothetical protein
MNNNLSEFEGFTPIVEEEEEEELILEGFTPTPEPITEPIQRVDTSAFEGFEADTSVEPEMEEPTSLVPSGFSAGEYSQDTLVEDGLFQPIEEYMNLRYGIQATEGQSREDIVDKFLNNRRGNAMGNSISALSEADFLYGIKDKPEVLAKVGRAYGVYENMAGLFSGETSGMEKAEIVKDSVISLILDPINLAGGIIGRAVGGTATRAGVKALNKLATKAAMQELTKQAGKAGAKKAAARVYKAAATTAQAQAAKEMTEYAAKLAGTKGFKRVMTKAGLKEVGATALVDSIAGTGTEWLYQRSLVQTDVQEEVNPYAVGLAALSGMVMGGVQAGRVALRGSSKQTLVSEAVQQGDPKTVAREMQESIAAYMQSGKVDKTSSWASKLEDGEELAAKDTDFFIELLLGRTAVGGEPVVNKAGEAMEEGDQLFKGLGQIMQENGFFYVKRDPDDKISNFIADFIKEMDDVDAQGIVRAYSENSGNVIKDLDNITAESLGDLFASKMNQGARTMNAAKQLSDGLDINIEDLGLDKYLEAAMGLKMVETPPTKFDEWVAGTGAGVRKAQNNMIRSLVSHPSTSMLNVVGYGAASAIGSASDMAQALLYASRGALHNMVGQFDKGADFNRIASSLAKANANRVKLLVDPDMTAEVFKSALLRNTGAMEKLSRVQSGGVEIASGIEELAKMGGTQRAFWQKAEGGIDIVQAATFVDAQDIWTKSQEYVFQMDKNLRTTFNMSFDEFYTSPDAQKVMATKRYKQLEATAVDKTLEMTFSKSYKGKKALGEIAGFIEDARNIPGLGALVPFGKFFNNTIDFTIKNSPIGLAAKVTGLGYKDVPITEMVSRTAVAAGLAYAMSDGEDEARRQGLGLYEKVNSRTGEARSLQYDYPLSLFKAAGRIYAYKRANENVPDEIAKQVIRDFFGGSLTRNISKSGDVMVDAVASLIKMELEDAAGKAKQAVGSIGSQYVSASTRFLEPINEIVGLVSDVERAPELNTKTGVNKQIKDSMRYFNNVAELFTGKASQTKYSSTEGEMGPQATRMVGTRAERHTDALRVMHMLGYEGWQLNAAFKVSKATPEAGNEYQNNFFNFIENEASVLMDNEVFRSLSTEQQRIMWKSKVEKVKKMASRDLLFKAEGSSTLYEQYELVNSSSSEELQRAMEELGVEGKDVFDLNMETLIILKNSIKTQKTLDAMDIPSAAYD